MAMTQGSVSVNPTTGVVTGTGFAKELYDDYAPKALADLPESASTAVSAAAKQRIADLCNSIAKVIGHVKDNAQVQVTIHTTDAGLQITPNPNLADSPTQGPSVDKTLNGTVT